MEIHALRCLASASFRQKTEDPEILRNLPPTELSGIFFQKIKPIEAQSQNTFGRRSFQRESQNTCSPVFAGNFL